MISSSELRVLVDPAPVFRAPASDGQRGVWLFVRRPLLLLFVLGCVVSMQASGRFTLRLIADGMISFAFVPIFEVIALAAVYRRQPREIPFARAVDLFFVANAPWLLWLIAFAVLRAVESPVQATAPPYLVFVIVIGSLVPTAAWSAWIDLHYFREILPLGRGVIRDLLLERAMAWLCALTYFLGLAVWPQIVGRIAA